MAGSFSSNSFHNMKFWLQSRCVKCWWLSCSIQWRAYWRNMIISKGKISYCFEGQDFLLPVQLLRSADSAFILLCCINELNVWWAVKNKWLWWCMILKYKCLLYTSRAPPPVNVVSLFSIVAGLPGCREFNYFIMCCLHQNSMGLSAMNNTRRKKKQGCIIFHWSGIIIIIIIT